MSPPAPRHPGCQPQPPKRAPWLRCAAERVLLAVGTVYFFEQLLTQYGTDPDVTRLVDAYEWILVPVVNVDGFEFGWDSDSFRTWRKTRSMHAENLEAFAACELVTPGQCEGCVGTDPNRNWVSDPPTPGRLSTAVAAW